MTQQVSHTKRVVTDDVEAKSVDRCESPCSAAYPKLYHDLGADTISLTSLGSEVVSTRCPECAAAIILDSSSGFRKPGPGLFGDEAGRFLGDGLALMVGSPVQLERS
jgi:hypothetical protein